MNKQRNAIRAGLFMLVSVALVIFAIIAVSGAGRFTQSFRTYLIEFTLQDDVGGLRVGDDVRIGGLKVGSVRDLQISAPSAGNSAGAAVLIVAIEVPSKYRLGNDASVGVQKSITGSASINIDNLGVGQELASTDHLRGRPDSLSALLRGLGTMEPDIKQIVTNINTASGKLNSDLDKFGRTADTFTETGFTATATVQDLHVRLPQIVQRYDDVVSSAVAMLDAVRDFVGPGSHDFHATIANLQRISTDLRDRLPEILDQTRTILHGVDVAVNRADNAMLDIQATVANTRDITVSARSLIVDNRSKLEGMIASLKSTSDNLKAASIEIRRSPWRLLYQPKPDESANLNTYDSMRQFAEGAGSLDDAAAALRDALQDKNADPEQIKKLMQHLDESFTKFQAVEQSLWKQIKE